MKVNDNDSQDVGFKRVLQTWRVERGLPPRFKEQVWRRIAKAEEHRGSWRVAWARFLDGLTMRPAFAAVYLGGLLMLGLAAGHWSAENFATRADSQMRTAYLESVTPFFGANSIK